MTEKTKKTNPNHSKFARMFIFLSFFFTESKKIVLKNEIKNTHSFSLRAMCRSSVHLSKCDTNYGKVQVERLWWWWWWSKWSKNIHTRDEKKRKKNNWIGSVLGLNARTYIRFEMTSRIWCSKSSVFGAFVHKRIEWLSCFLAVQFRYWWFYWTECKNKQ